MNSAEKSILDIDRSFVDDQEYLFDEIDRSFADKSNDQEYLFGEIYEFITKYIIYEIGELISFAEFEEIVRARFPNYIFNFGNCRMLDDEMYDHDCHDNGHWSKTFNYPKSGDTVLVKMLEGDMKRAIVSNVGFFTFKSTLLNYEDDQDFKGLSGEVINALEFIWDDYFPKDLSKKECLESFFNDIQHDLITATLADIFREKVMKGEFLSDEEQEAYKILFEIPTENPMY